MIPLFPQEQRAVPARRKEQWEADPVLGAAIAAARARLGAGGRVLVRPSGTEPALRVMVEGPDAAIVLELARHAGGPRGRAPTLGPGWAPARMPGKVEVVGQMCGIVGYTGPRPAGPILMEGLRRLEYRGYDSAGNRPRHRGG